MTETIKRRPRPDTPAPDEIVELRKQAGRTQTQVAQLLRVSLRQVQRWEHGEQDMPSATWRFFKLTCGYYYPVDFERVEDFERHWNTLRDRPRHTIERGDVVELRALNGTRLLAAVWLDRTHDGLADEESYGAIVREFPDYPQHAQVGKFRVEDRVTFARSNVIHLVQREPAA
ncbi:helix-turn-helix domain-containing protein [Burkholderia multivorans]|uniref:helix-turn-helix domain-containing protein n=1 Tax=Burkholderia multivorans TaxID=87883 RepID=UPI00158DBAD6|nr:helix-turn-helix domain-containing protein [Burkholderia multivorans]